MNYLEDTRMRASFVHNRFFKNKGLCKRIIALTAALAAAVCLLSACGPEPGIDGGAGQAEGGGMFPGENPDTSNGNGAEADAGSKDGKNGAQEGSSGEETAADGHAGTGQEAFADPGANTAGSGNSGSALTGAESAEENYPARPIQGEITRSDAQTLQTLQEYLNEDSSYGFLLSSYDIPEDIDLNQVFYSGAGIEQEKLTDQEKDLLLDRIPQEEIRTPVVKVADDQIEDLLSLKTGLSYDRFRKQLDEKEGWVRIARYQAWYALRGDTNRMYVRCTDAWQQGDTFIVHYQLEAQQGDIGQETEQAVTDSVETDVDDVSNAGAESAASSAAEVAETAQKGEAADRAAASDTAGSAASAASDTAATAASAASATAATAASAASDTAAAAASADTVAEEAGSETADTSAAESEESAAAANDALYQPTYEVELQKADGGYRFCYNIVWTQKDLIEAQSYSAELNPAGEVFFAPFYPDTKKNEKADVTFALEQDRAILAILDPIEAGNIRTDRVFAGVDAVDFTDYNKDGYTDILTVCSYTQVGEDGKKTGNVREARVYSGQKDAVPALDSTKTEAVNRDVEVLNITNVTSYLTGKNDGTAQKYSSWKEAYADRIKGIDEEEYEGFALIYLNDDRTPELVQVGATAAKGVTIVVYRSGTLEETWLNRRDFQYLEYENLLYSPSGVENLHFDTIYSISGGRLGVSVQGYYGNNSFARVRFDERGEEVWDYYWEGGQVSESGYRDGLSFVFDTARARTCKGEQLLTAEELLQQLQ